MTAHGRGFLFKIVFSLTFVACVALLLIGFQNLTTSGVPSAALDATAMIAGPEGGKSAVDASKTRRPDAGQSKAVPGARGPSASGRGEFNKALDWVLGIRRTDIESLSPDRGPYVTSARMVLAQQTTPPGTARQAAPSPVARPEAKSAEGPKGKKRAPGTVSPMSPAAREESLRAIFAAERDPFKPPTEILPSECPPSLPLCRYDRAQLKLVGVIQVEEGYYKGMVEDPDGRGYFITSGMQIGSGTAAATVTQINEKGITLHVHQSRQDVPLPLHKEPREGLD